MPQIVVPAEEKLAEPCTELWADPDRLAEEKSLTPEESARAVLEATWAINVLTGSRFSGPQCWMEDYSIRPGQTRLQIQRTVDDLFYVELRTGCSDDDPDEIVEDLNGACLVGGGLVQLRHGGDNRFMYDPMYSGGLGAAPCGQSGEIARVMYRTENTVPLGADRVVMDLAEQYVLALHGDKKCKLPERISTVTRQGVTWTVMDPQEFFRNGLIGIGSVDHWLNIINSDARTLRATNTLHSGVRRRAVLIGCGATCESVGNWPATEDDES